MTCVAADDRRSSASPGGVAARPRPLPAGRRERVLVDGRARRGSSPRRRPARRGALIGAAFAAAVAGALFGPVVGGVASVAGIGWTFGVARASASLGARRLGRADAGAPPSDEPQDRCRRSCRALRDRSILGSRSGSSSSPRCSSGRSACSRRCGSRRSASARSRSARSSSAPPRSRRATTSSSDTPRTGSGRSSPISRPASSRRSSSPRCCPGRTARTCSRSLVVCAGLAFGTFFTPGMTLLSNLAEQRGLALRLRARADQPRVGAGPDARRGGRRRARRRRRATPCRTSCSPACASRRSSCCGGPPDRAGAVGSGREELLVANRGEIALRVFRAARELGLGTVAVVAPDDAGSLHARSADETVEIALLPRSGASTSAPRARRGADAIHPGYGFLAENGDFAEAVESGRASPGSARRPAALRRGGDKLEAKRIARRGRRADRARGRREPPLIVKAAAGGGGRGMRIVRSRDELDDGARRRAARGAGRRSATTASISSATSSGRGTSRSSCSPTRTARCSRSASASARCSAATRRCSRSRRRPRSTPSCARRCATPRSRFARAIGYVGAGTAEFVLDGPRVLLPRAERPHPGRAPGDRGGDGHRPRAVAAADRARRAARPAAATRGASGRGAPLRGGSADVPAAGGAARAAAAARRRSASRPASPRATRSAPATTR